MTPESVRAIHITHEIDGQQVLFLLLASDGLVNRMGNSSPNNRDFNLYIGRADGLFDRLRGQIQPDWIDRQGLYEHKTFVGAITTLTVALHGEGEKVVSFRFRYSEDARGPLPPLVPFVDFAIRLTDPWYMQQKSITKPQPVPSKPWWRFW
jgi:hypothetical protein